MVYREELKRYDGLLTAHSLDNNRTVEVQIRNTIVPKSTSVVKKLISIMTIPLRKKTNLVASLIAL